MAVKCGWRKHACPESFPVAPTAAGRIVVSPFLLYFASSVVLLFPWKTVSCCGENQSSYVQDPHLPCPKLLGAVTGPLLGYCFHTGSNELVLTESLYKEVRPVLWAEAETGADSGPADCWVRIGSQCSSCRWEHRGRYKPFYPKTFHYRFSVSLNP